MAFSNLAEYKWIYGGPFDFWVQYRDFAKRAVDGLKPLGPEFGSVFSAGATAQVVALREINPRGGMRIAHIHLGDDVYIVDQGRWNEFTKQVFTDVSKKLSNSGRVGFQQLLGVADAANALG